MENSEDKGSIGSRLVLLKHPFFERSDGIRVEEHVLRGLSPSIKAGIRLALQGISPQSVSFSETPPSFRAIAIEDSSNIEEDGKDRIGAIILAGASATASGIAHTGLKVLEGLKKTEGVNPGKIITIGSPFSLDIESEEYSKSHFERAAYQAAFILELLKQSPGQQVYLIGHSAGALEIIYLLPILESLMKQNDISPNNIKGLIFFQPGGLYEQSSVNFIGRKIPKAASFNQERIQLFPSVEDIADIKTSIAHAKENRVDVRTIAAMEQTLVEMEDRRKNPPFLDDQQKQQLREIDFEIDKAMFEVGGEKRLPKLYKHRNRLLAPVIKKLSLGADIWEGKPISPRFFARYALRNLVPGADGIISSVPKLIRERIKRPVALVFSHNDPYFPYQEAREGLINQNLSDMKDQDGWNIQSSGGLVNIFPNIPVLFEAQVQSFPHAAIATDAEGFSKVVVDIIRKMRNFEENGQKSGVEKINLWY